VLLRKSALSARDRLGRGDGGGYAGGVTEAPLVDSPPEPWWVKTSYLTAAAVAAVGDGLMLVAGSSSNRAWTAYLGVYLALASVAAFDGGVARPGITRSACRGAATGAAGAFSFLGVLTIGALFVPLTAWLAVSTFSGGRLQPAHVSVTALATAVAVLIPLAGVMTVFQW
jgi:hypothetical protein